MILVLGGTRFLGRHIVEALAAAGHRVVRFHRGNTPAPLPEGVEERLGDRTDGLDAVNGESWDAVVDVAAYEPAQVRRSLELRCDRYVFISTVSVYRDFAHAGIAEDAPVYETFDPSDDVQRYGGNKAACEREIVARHGDRATILRPGLIAGPWDPTGRFSYWCERATLGGKFVVPLPADRNVQFVDARDVANFVAHTIEDRIGGTFNVVGPKDPMTMTQLLDRCIRAANERGAPPSEPVWVDESFLLERGVEAWREMPLWIPEPEMRGILEIDGRKAGAAGLTLRPAEETAGAVMDWLAQHPECAALNGVTPERQAEWISQL